MKLRKLICLLLALTLAAGLCAGAQAEGALFFVAVNDTIPVTLTASPLSSGGVTYVPYTAFDARPGNVVSAYNAAEQTFVLFTKDYRLVFDLATGEVTDENQNVSTQTTLFRNNLLYIPLVFCASHFGLKVSMLESRDGYEVLRFTTGSEVYDDSLFIEKAENLIAYRISQQSIGTADGQEQPGQTGGNSAAAQDPPEEEKTPAQVYLAFTDAQTMEESAAALEAYQLRGTFFLTEAEIEADPALVRSLYAAGHVLGVTVPEDTGDPAAALKAANESLDAVLNLKSLLALLPAGMEEPSGSWRVFSADSAAPDAETAISNPLTPHLLLCGGGAQVLLAELYAANASVRLLRETAPLT